MVSVRGEKQQNHQGVEDMRGNRDGALAARVIGTAHGHTHLHIYHSACQQGNIEENIDCQTQYIAQDKFQQQPQRQLQQGGRHSHAPAPDTEHRHGQHHNYPCLDHAGRTPASNQRV